jgi:hypothetical protein
MRELPEWYMPPRMVGGHAAGPDLVHRSETVVLAVRQVVAYPVGFEVEVEAHAHGPYPAAAPPGAGPGSEHGSGPGPGPFGRRESPRFRLRYSDGTVVVQDDDAGLRTGRGPMITISKAEHSAGGPDNAESARLNLWIWPLPAPSAGPLTLYCSWPRRGLREAAFDLDVGALRAAANRAEWFWPRDPEAGG